MTQLADGRIAGHAEKTTDPLGLMVMIYVELSLLATYRAFSLLLQQHGLIVLGAQPVTLLTPLICRATIAAGLLFPPVLAPLQLTHTLLLFRLTLH